MHKILGAASVTATIVHIRRALIRDSGPDPSRYLQSHPPPPRHLNSQPRHLFNSRQPESPNLNLLSKLQMPAERQPPAIIFQVIQHPHGISPVRDPSGRTHVGHCTKTRADITVSFRGESGSRCRGSFLEERFLVNKCGAIK
jgi:hypothetical protein